MVRTAIVLCVVLLAFGPAPALSQGGACQANAAFVKDVSVPDDTAFAAGQSFEKIWRVKNTGTCEWGAGYAPKFGRGDSLGAADSQPQAAALAAGKTADITVKMTAPATDGSYAGYWRMADASGAPFGAELNGKSRVGAAGLCSTWNLGSDFRRWPDQENPNRDACGRSNIWYFLESSSLDRDPQTYFLLPKFVSDVVGIVGLEGWQDAVDYQDLPEIAINATGITQTLVTWEWPPDVVKVHPSLTKLSIVGWRSPLSGEVAISGSVTDLDGAGGDGIEWYIDKGGTNLAFGSYEDGGEQSLQDGSGGSNLTSVAVNPGEFIYFIVHPKGRHEYDSTQLDITITSLVSVNKTASKSKVTPGERLDYTIVLHNGLGSDVGAARVTDTLPGLVTYLDGSLTASGGSSEYDAGVIKWSGPMAADEAVTLTFGATAGTMWGKADNVAALSVEEETTTSSVTTLIYGRVCDLVKSSANPVLPFGPAGSWDSKHVWHPAVLEESGAFKMWYTGTDGANPARIGLATSPDGVHWTRDSHNPVLSPGDSWDSAGVKTGVVITDGGYKMWYTGVDAGNVARIGYATSTDGVAWTKHGGNPVFDVGASGGWEDDEVREPTVLKQGSTYHLWYTGSDGVTLRIGHATSGDGFNWTRDPSNPVLDVGAPGDWDWLQAYGASAVIHDGLYLLWYSGSTLPEVGQTGFAVSGDGSHWTPVGRMIPSGASGAFDAHSADYPSVLMNGAQFKIWYSALNESNRYTIGYAEAESCVAVSASPQFVYLPVVVKGFGPQPACPAYYADPFSDPGSGWPVDDDSDAKFAYTGGQYQVWVKKASRTWLVTPGAKATDFTAAVSARRSSGSTGGYGIVFGVNEDWTEYYELDVGAGKYSLWKYDRGGWTALVGSTASASIKTGANWNRLKVVRSMTDISVYVNNQLLTTVSDGSFVGLRRIGLLAYSPSTSGLDVRFDDFSLYPASCGPGAARAAFEMGQPAFHEAPRSPGSD